MKPLNTVERSKAFWRFLGLFAVTIGLVATVIFFSMQVSGADTRQLRQRVADAENKGQNTEAFTIRVRETLAELAKYETGEGLPPAIYQNVLYRLNDLNNMLRQLPNSQQSIYALSVQTLDDLNKAKKQISETKPK